MFYEWSLDLNTPCNSFILRMYIRLCIGNFVSKKNLKGPAHSLTREWRKNMNIVTILAQLCLMLFFLNSRCIPTKA